MPSGRDSFRRNRVAPLPVFYHVYMRFLRCRTNSNENAGSPRSAFRASLEPQSLARLKRLQKRDQIVFVLLREMQAEPGVIKIERVHKRRGGAIVKVWRATCQPSQDWSLKLADVCAFSGNHRTANVGDLRDHARRVTHHRDEWKIRRSEGAIHESDIERCGHGMVSDIWRVVARTAKTVDGISVQDVVEPSDSRDRDF